MALESKEGTNVPNVTFKTINNGQWKDISTESLFANKKVIVFSLPGAFTPTCSSSHLPRYNELFPVFAKHGVDAIICISVNDTFVMNSWQADQNAKNITFIPDGNGDFSREMGMLVDKNDLGFGQRSWRYSMLVDNGNIEKMFIEPQEPGDPFKVSDADTMLKHVAPNHSEQKSVAIFTKPGCPHCKKAKENLDNANLAYDEIVIGKDTSIVGLRAVSGKMSAPQIFVGGEYIGGNQELEAYLNN